METPNMIPSTPDSTPKIPNSEEQVRSQLWAEEQRLRKSLAGGKLSPEEINKRIAEMKEHGGVPMTKEEADQVFQQRRMEQAQEERQGDVAAASPERDLERERLEDEARSAEALRIAEEIAQSLDRKHEEDKAKAKIEEQKKH